MTPERARVVLDCVVMSLRLFAEEADAIEAVRARHLAASLRQAETSLRQMIQRDSTEN